MAIKEIKFRVWDKILKDMVNMNDNSIEFFDDGSFSIRNMVGDFINDQDPAEDDYMDDSKRYVVMQFSGLKDKNGREIYEGDFVREKHSNYPYCRLITYDFHSDHSSYMYQIGFNLWEDEEIVIIGNKYENPELLKESTNVD